MKIIQIGRRSIAVAGLTAALAVVGAGAAAADAAPAPYNVDSATVSVTHKMFAADNDVSTSCKTGYHVHGGMTSGGAFISTVIVHGDWIYNDGASNSNQVGTIPAKPGSWPTPEYQTVKVGLKNSSFKSDHDGWYTITCDPNV